ncbi:DUF6640 family protein [Rhodococcoides corynebacterioides]|uniref:DUF6640 family protein n=1 Tax=Rhodococcoides corynebacterioides TaxID=53972 RepID=UPI001C9AF1A1|nr:DUF6640 family protein [Rhodococcus corynebacterioides]MBY6348996.1 hypothetical protein [Rhodococcus corynebacterioides]
MIVLVQVLFTISILSFALVAAAADLNRTHATNPVWVPHARFHVVWQVATHIGAGLLALVVLWAPVASLPARFAIAGAIAGVVLVGFFVTAATMPLYGGELADSNGYRPLTLDIAGRTRTFDQNVLLFAGGVGFLLLAGALALTL